jgi:hypothetical protein
LGLSIREHFRGGESFGMPAGIAEIANSVDLLHLTRS